MPFVRYAHAVRRAIAEDNKNQHSSRYPISVKFRSALRDTRLFIAGIR